MKSCTLTLTALLCACASSTAVGPSFNTDWQNDAGASIAAVEQKLRGTPPPPTVNVAVGLTADALLGVPLDGGTPWKHPKTSDSPPVIAGDLVVFSSGGELFALDARTGERRWKIGVAGYRLRGAGDDGTVTVATLGQPDGARSLLVTVSRNGSVLEHQQTTHPLGRPAARGGVAFVPWSGQYVSAIDMESGDEIGRLLTRELTSHALQENGELYFGEKGVIRFDERIKYASTQQANRAGLPQRELPGKPRWLDPGETLPELDMGARAKTRIYAAPRFDEPTRFASNRFVATYFKTVMAFDAKSGDLSWTTALPSDVIGGDAAAQGFVLCTQNGRLHTFAADGSPGSTLGFGTHLRACVVEAGAFVARGVKAAEPLTNQLERTLLGLEPDMATAQLFLLEELGKLSDPSVAKTLIELAQNPRTPPAVRNESRRLLSTRKSGAEHMLAALEAPFDFLSTSRLPAPVGPLADALAAMREERAATLLARHLNDPATALEDLEPTARALATLATPNEFQALRTFFALYRSTADDPALVTAVVAVARALLRVGGSEGRAIVVRAASDPMTQPEVARGLAALDTALPSARAEAR